MVEGWERRRHNWYLNRDGVRLGSIHFLGDCPGGGRYRPVAADSTPLSPRPLPQDAALALVERHAGVTGAVPDLALVGVVGVHRVRCTGGCGTLLRGGAEFADVLAALRAARADGWITPPEFGARREEKMPKCPPCRKKETG